MNRRAENRKGQFISELALGQLLVRLAGFEPTTPWFVAKYSIQLSYSRAERQDYITVGLSGDRAIARDGSVVQRLNAGRETFSLARCYLSTALSCAALMSASASACSRKPLPMARAAALVTAAT